MKKLKINKGDTIVIQKFNWFDKANGNSYNALRVRFIRNGRTIGTLTRGFDYGYEDAGNAAAQLLAKVQGFQSQRELIQYLRDEKSVAWIVVADAERTSRELRSNYANDLTWEGECYTYSPHRFDGFKVSETA